MTKALLVIDYTNDLAADNGSLACGRPAQTLEDYLVELADQFYESGDYVAFPADDRTGDKFNPEYKLFPPHNIVGTPNQGLYGRLEDWYENHKSSDRTYKFNKSHYSSFQNTNLDNYLRERKIDSLWLTGVCTDIRILHTTVSAYNLNYGITVPTKSATAFTEHGQEWALDRFRNSPGVTLI